MDNRRLFLVFFTAFILNVGMSDCQNSILENIRSSFSQRCQVPDRIPATNNVRPKRLKIYIYYQQQLHVYPLSRAAARLANSPKFNPEFTTVVFVNGFTCPPTDKYVSALAEAFAKLGGVNFIVYDFFSYAVGPAYRYFETVEKTLPLSKYLSDFLIDLTEQGVSRNNIHLLGFSYGGHLAGIAGLYFRKAIGKPLARITALDPTTICFPESTKNRLRPSSAKFVDILRTSLFSSGVRNMGHVHYKFNNIMQPGCEQNRNSIRCEHDRSIILYVESILDKESLLAVKCDNWNEFSKGKCQNNILSPIGFHSRTDIKGNFFIRTAVKPPYGIGLGGLY